jgi:hypothetical protein
MGLTPRKWTGIGAVLALALAGAVAFHLTTALDERSLEWSLPHEGVTDQEILWACEPASRDFTCHESDGDNVPFRIEREGRRCWRVRRLITTQGGKAGTVAATGCYDGWDRLYRLYGGGPKPPD